MKKRRIFNLRDLLKKVKEEHGDFCKKVSEEGGFNLYFRSLVGQLLWYNLFFSITLRLSPFKNNLFILGILFIFSLIIKSNKLPKYIKLLKGDFLFELEEKFLNTIVFSLVFLNYLVSLTPIDFFEKYKPNEKK